jgi:hypothetical protein
MEVPIKGGSASLREYLTVGERRRFILASSGSDEKNPGPVMDAREDLLLLLLESWTLPKAKPTNREMLWDLAPEEYDPMQNFVDTVLGKALEGINPEPSPETSSPTNGSPGSSTTSKDEPTPMPPSTLSSLNGGESLATESSSPVLPTTST